MLVLLILGASVCVGLSYDSYVEEEYGNTHRMRLLRKTHSIKFVPKHSSDAKILWRQDDPPADADGRWKVMGSYFVIHNLTQRDSGWYVMIDKHQKELSTKIILVAERTVSLSLSPEQLLNISFPLEQSSCNIYFFPDGEDNMIEVVLRGNEQWDLSEIECSQFYVLKPCRLLNEHIHASCTGRLEGRDQNGDTALVVFLDVTSWHFDHSYLAIAIGPVLAALCCLVRCCCCRKKSETPAAEPAVHYHAYEHESALLKPHGEPSGTHPPAQPFHAPTSPRIKNPPAVNATPAYSQVSAPDAAAAPAEQADAPAAPPCSDPEPRFEVKWASFPSSSPLSSDPTCCDVYTSDKLL